MCFIRDIGTFFVVEPILFIHPCYLPAYQEAASTARAPLHSGVGDDLKLVMAKRDTASQTEQS